MVKIGCLARFYNKYEDEVQFAKDHGFDFMQLWYDRNGLSLHEGDSVETLKRHDFPTIVHAVLNIEAFEEHLPKLIGILNTLQHKELIIHPVCENNPINDNTLAELNEKVALALDALSREGITLYLENNSKLDPIFTDSVEIEKIFSENSTLEFVLDIAHMDSLEHLEEMVHIKTPKILHIADKHFHVLHEHLPIGNGEIDFDYIFRNILKDYEGKVVLEIIETNADLINSKAIISKLVNPA